MARNLTDQQKLFLEVLFDQAGGDVVKAKRLAGYSETYPTSAVLKTLEDEIIAATKLFLSRSGPKAAIAISGVIDDPTQLGVKEKIMAAKDILDRIGVSKTEKIDISGHGIVLLPSKRDEDEA